MTETFILVLLCCLTKSLASIQDHRQKGSSLSVDDDDAQHFPETNLVLLASMALRATLTGLQSGTQTPVWTANRNTPVNGRGSKLTVQRNGSMVLTDVDEMVVWETNTTSTNANRAVLLNTTNLVLKNQKERSDSLA